MAGTDPARGRDRGPVRRTLDRDLAALRRDPAKVLAGRAALVLLAQLKADEYDRGPEPALLVELLKLTDRIGIGKVQLVNRPGPPGDEFDHFVDGMGHLET